MNFAPDTTASEAAPTGRIPAGPAERTVSADPQSYGRTRRRTAGNRLTAAAVGLVSVAMYWPYAFGVWHSYDDEGAMLVLFRSFAERGGLYRTTYNNYGPFPFALWWSTLRPFGFSFDSLFVGRMLALVLLALTAGLAALATARVAGRLSATVVGLAVADLLTVNFNEPLHPGALIGFGLLGIVWAHISLDSVRTRNLLTGVVCAALALTKINLGFFALLAWFTATVFATVHPSKRLFRRSLAVLVSAFPLAIVLAGTREWRTLFMATSVTVALGLTSYAWFANTPEPPSDRRAITRDTVWFATGGFLVAVFSLGVVLFRGSSASDVFTGMVGRAVRQRNIFTLLVFTDATRIVLLLLAACVTLLCLSRARRFQLTGGPSRWEVLLVVFVEIVGGGELLTVPSYGLSLLPVVALLVGPSLTDGTSGTADRSIRARLLFPVILGLLQVLHAYPVAGSQMGWAMLVVTVLGGLLVGRGVRDAAVLAAAFSVRSRLMTIASVALAVIGVTVLLGFVQGGAQRWSRYRHDSPLDATNAPFVRIDPETATTLQAVGASLSANCSAYYSLPGMGTFSVLTRLPLATGFNATVWPLLFDRADQRRVVSDLEKVDRLCVVRNEPLLDGWMQGRPVPDGPLLDYLKRFDHPILTAGDYRVSTR